MRLQLLILLMVPLAGCTLGTPKTATIPPPPKAQAAPAPAQEAQLSVPQTQVTLPSQQEFNPDSIPKPVAAQAAPPPEKAEAPPPVRVSRRAAAAGPQRAETAEQEAEPPAAAPAVQEQAPIQPILGDEDLRKIKVNIDARKKDIGDRLRRTKGAASAHDKSLVERIKSFLEQCESAEKRGDYSQADALSERALVLVKELSE